MKNHLTILSILCSFVFISPRLQAASLTDTSVLTSESNGYMRLNEVNMQAARHFKKKFSTDDEKWTKLNTGYLATYFEHSVATLVYYDTRGKFLYGVKHFNETTVPADLRQMIRRQYENYTIIGMNEIITEDNSYYLTYIQSNRLQKTVRIDDQGMMELDN